MAEPDVSTEDEDPQAVLGNEEIIVLADEVDESGADISTISSSNDEELGAKVEARRQQDFKNTDPKPLANDVSSRLNTPLRPILQRESSNPPPPPQQPPPPAPSTQQAETPNTADSLNLAQLRDVVANLPKLEPAAYAYTYDDSRTFAEELEEWFQYTEEDRLLLLHSFEAYEEIIKSFDFPSSVEDQSTEWLQLSPKSKELFVKRQCQTLRSLRDIDLTQSLESLAYVALGAWKETSLLKEEPSPSEEKDFEPPNDKYRRSIPQLNCIRASADLFGELGVAEVLYDIAGTICDYDQPYATSELPSSPTTQQEMAWMDTLKGRQLSAALTILYFMVESGIQQVRRGDGNSIRQCFVELKPNILHYLSQLVARIRWDDNSNVPLTRILLLLWKLTFLVFGGTKDLIESKAILKSRPETNPSQDESFLTASPLDYHIFRQEITSKYPAYNPPLPLLPLEPNNNTILPPLAHHTARSPSHESLFLPPGAANGVGKSIFHQPVHISTPAPSPPPSPAGPGGKGGKKQNYQTNQNFPFLYPPLDSSSSEIGGKGNAGMQDKLVGKRWNGSDVPTSILEAGQLFASRMRMTRSLRQLWDVREEYIKHERGWEDEDERNNGEASDSEDEDEDEENRSLEDQLNGLTLGGEATNDENHQAGLKSKSFEETAEKEATRLIETDDTMVQSRLDAIEDFYRLSLPYLQSIVIVLLKIILSNVTALSNQGNGQSGATAPAPPRLENGLEGSLPKFNVNLAKQLTVTGPGSSNVDGTDGRKMNLEELNTIRTREISSKAIAGFLLLFLKWLKLSHILKFEYLTQLLLDSNYLPLALKFFALQDIDKAVDNRNDREEYDFFRLCLLDAGCALTPPEVIAPKPTVPDQSSSDDEAQPPPISRNRRSPPVASPPTSPRASPPPPPPRPEVDELGYPTTTLPQAPLTNYAPRFFQTTICHLRILQKLTKRHAHRALLLVQYKSSTILRRNLKIPQPELRLYTLKLFKSQVPFCGRKWRSSNMRVLTAIYLHCRMELRDEWISGGSLDDCVEEAVPIERGWRSLGWWWHLRNYKNAMGLEDRDRAEGDNDFFVRELEKMGWGVHSIGDGEEDLEEMAVNGTEWDGAPLQLEGW